MNDIVLVRDGRVVVLAEDGVRQVSAGPRGGAGPEGSDAPRPAAAWLSAADLRDGVDGGLGLVELAAVVHGFDLTCRYGHDASGCAEPRADRAMPAMIEAATAGAFDALVVSAVASFGVDLAEAMRSFRHLVECGVTVYSGREGLLTPDDFTLTGR